MKHHKPTSLWVYVFVIFAIIDGFILATGSPTAGAEWPWWVCLFILPTTILFALDAWRNGTP